MIIDKTITPAVTETVVVSPAHTTYTLVLSPEELAYIAAAVGVQNSRFHGTENMYAMYAKMYNAEPRETSRICDSMRRDMEVRFGRP